MSATVRRARGFILLTVVLALTLVAAVAFLLNRGGGMNMSMAARGLEADRARYVAEAGLAHVNYQTHKANCMNYPLGQTTTQFGADSFFTTTVTPNAGRRVTLTATGTTTTAGGGVGGAAATLIRRNVTCTVPVILGTAGNFAILTKTGITNTGSHLTKIIGNIGSSGIAAAAMDGVFCTEITGRIYGDDATYTGSADTTCFAGNPGVPPVVPPDANATLVANAVLDMGIAYTDAAGRTLPDFTELGAGDISGMTLAPGLYKWSTGLLIDLDVTLSGGADDIWIFQIAGTLGMATGKKVILAGGARAKNIFWQVANVVTLGTNSHFEGIILGKTIIVPQTGASINGRLLAQTAVTLDQNAVTQPIP